MILRLALASLRSRTMTVSMTILTIAVSVTLFLGVEKVRTGARASFTSTISGTDLIMGARSGSVQLLLYSVFRIGNAPNNIKWQSYQDIARRPEVAWTVPISLGDSHRQFRVMGTTNAFFEHYRYRSARGLELAEGALISDLFDTVIGADVAKALGYELGAPLVVSHGIGSFSHHNALPFRVSGILEKTGTPVDRTVIISLRAVEAIHIDRRGADPPTPADTLREMPLEPVAITAVLIGTKSRLQVFTLQRSINTYAAEPLLGILPGVALLELWQIVGLAETALLAISAMVVLTALIGMMATLYSSLSARRREMAIYRAMGAGPRTILLMLVLEATLIALIGALIGLALLYASLLIGRPFIDAAFGLWLPIGFPSLRDASLLLGVIASGACVSAAPAWQAYRISLADGMMVRL